MDQKTLIKRRWSYKVHITVYTVEPRYFEVPKEKGKCKIRNNESFFNKIQYSMKKDTD